MRDVYEEYLQWAIENATYPYYEHFIPKLKVLSDTIFENYRAPNIEFAATILDCLLPCDVNTNCW